MARGTRASEEAQLELIDVEPENAKKIKSAIRTRNKYNEEHLAAKKKADEWDIKIMDLVKETGVKPDADGNMRVKCGDSIICIKAGKAKLSIKEENADSTVDEEEEADAEGEEEGVEPIASRRPRG